MEGVDCLLSEFLIALDVRLPVVCDEGGSVRHGVEQRPEGTVAATIVVAVEEFRFGVDWYNLKRGNKILGHLFYGDLGNIRIPLIRNSERLSFLNLEDSNDCDTLVFMKAL